MTFGGSLCFGIVVGWITYRMLRRSQPNGLSDIAVVIGAVGGAGVTALFRPGTDAFNLYCIGLASGFFAYLVTAMFIAHRTPEMRKVDEWMGTDFTSHSGVPSRDAERAPATHHSS